MLNKLSNFINFIFFSTKEEQNYLFFLYAVFPVEEPSLSSLWRPQVRL